MKPTAISLTALTALVLCPAVSSSRQVRYTYDDSGNRVARYEPEERLMSDTAVSIGDIKVYPSVTHDCVNVTTNSDLSNSFLTFSIRDIDGTHLSSGKITEPATTLPVDGTGGWYLINISSKKETASFKILKQ